MPSSNSQQLLLLMSICTPTYITPHKQNKRGVKIHSNILLVQNITKESYSTQSSITHSINKTKITMCLCMQCEQNLNLMHLEPFYGHQSYVTDIHSLPIVPLGTWFLFEPKHITNLHLWINDLSLLNMTHDAWYTYATTLLVPLRTVHNNPQGNHGSSHSKLYVSTSIIYIIIFIGT